MLYVAQVAVCSEIHENTKIHSGQNTEFTNFKAGGT